MHFRRITVRNFRKLASPLVIDDLGDGTTIIAGDNEEGKSTLLDAIRAGLFERHNLSGRAVEAMQPFGSSVRPEIQLGFEIDGKSYTITKGFAQSPSALLTTPNGTFEGPAAEDRLAELLTFQVPQRGKSKPDDQGVLGLFWLEQGRALGGLSFGESGRSTLRLSLEEEVGDVLGGARGHKLLESAKAKRNAVLTVTGRPRGELSAAIDETESVTKRVAGLETERRVYDQEIDALARVRRELAQIETDRVLETAQETLTKAQQEAKAIEGLRQQDETAAQAVALTQAQLDNVDDRWTRRQQLIQSIGHRERALNAAQASLSQLETEGQDVAVRIKAARAILETATQKKIAAESRLALSQNRARLEALDREVSELDRRRAEVNKLVVERTAAQERLVSIKIDKRTFEELQILEGAIREARAALGAIATRVRFVPSGSQAVRKDDQDVPAGEVVEVTEAARFTLEGFGGIEVEPGASELADRRTWLKEAESSLDKALAVAGVENMVQAKAQFTERTLVEVEINEAGRLIAAHAPKGIDTLRTTRRERSAEREQLKDKFDPSLGEGVADPETEAHALTSTGAAEKVARTASDAVQQKQREYTTKLAIAKQAVETADETLRMAKGDMETARTDISDVNLAARLKSARLAFDKAGYRKTETEKQFATANPEEVELRLQRAQSTLQEVEADQRRLRENAIGLENRLAALGQSGIGELLEEARGQKVQAIARRNRLQADAQAWDLLTAALSGAERDAKEAFLEPVLKRVGPFLRLLLPEARVTLDEETLEIVGVARDGREEPYEVLSIGTREQLSILVRLAFAVYLRGKGYPAAVILDDALVYADDDRFERMQLALRKAAQTVQVLILTCRPRDWRQFGAPIRRLADGRTSALEPA